MTQPIDNSQFTEEQRAEAYRIDSMRQMERQTKALESIRGMLTFIVVLIILGLVGTVLLFATANSRF